MDRSRRKALQRRCDALFLGLADRSLRTSHDLCAAVGVQRGRPLVVRPHPALLAPDAPCGVLLSTRFADVAFVEPRTSSPHQEHIALHELSHVLCDHDGQRINPTDARPLLAELLPHFDTSALTSVLFRTAYTNRNEEDAEYLATLLGIRLADTASRLADQPLAASPTAR